MRVQQLEQGEVQDEAAGTNDTERAQLLEQQPPRRVQATSDPNEAHPRSVRSSKPFVGTTVRVITGESRPISSRAMAYSLAPRTALPVVAMVGGGQLSRMTHQA